MHWQPYLAFVRFSRIEFVFVLHHLSSFRQGTDVGNLWARPFCSLCFAAPVRLDEVYRARMYVAPAIKYPVGNMWALPFCSPSGVDLEPTAVLFFVGCPYLGFTGFFFSHTAHIYFPLDRKYPIRDPCGQHQGRTDI